MSDGASTQKLFNKLVQEKIEAEQKDSVHATIPTNDTKNLLQLFCGMHLGVNLRAKATSELLSGRSVGADSVVHATCKLLCHLGTNPEYGRGVQAFPEYVQCLMEEADAIDDIDENVVTSLKSALGVRLCRQVASRYFVTARNAGRIFYLRDLIMKFLQSTALTKELNKLERAVLSYTSTDCELALFKVQNSP